MKVVTSNDGLRTDDKPLWFVHRVVCRSVCPNTSSSSALFGVCVGVTRDQVERRTTSGTILLQP